MNKKKVIQNTNPKVFEGICHRGFHNAEFTENGMNAFKNAIDHGFAFELDIHITKDLQVVVCHDSDLKRVTGKEGIIEDLTFAEIRENYRLHDGGVIPLLSEVFELTNEQVPIIVELKVYNNNYKELAREAKKVLATIKDKKNIVLISFDPRSLFPFAHSGFMRQLLVSSGHQYTWKYRHFVEGVDVDQKMLELEKYQSYHKRHVVNVWTIQSKEEFDRALPYIDTATFQLMDEEYVRTALKAKNNL